MFFYRHILIVIILLNVASAAFAHEGNEPMRVGIYQIEPLTFIDDEGNAQGLYPDLIRAMAEADDQQVTFIPGTWAECLERLQSGQIDLLAPMAITAERLETYDYNNTPVIDIWGQVFTRPGNAITHFGDLHGQRVAVVDRGVNGLNFVKISKELGVTSEVVTYATHADVFKAVADGEVVAGVAPQHFGWRNAETMGLVATSLKFSPLPIYFATLKGNSTFFLEQIDKHLTEWKNDENSIYYEKLAYWVNDQTPTRRIIPVWLITSLLGVVAIALLLIYLNRSLRRDATALFVENEARYKTLIDQFGDPVFICDSFGRLIDMNVPMYKRLGYSRKELLNLHLHNIDVESSGREEFREFIVALPYTQQVIIQRTCLRKDGTTFPAEMRLSRLDFKDQEIVFGTVRDVSEQKKRESILASRLSLTQFAQKHTSQELLQVFLDEVERLTGSTMGFFHYVDEEQKTLTTQTWSTNTVTLMCPSEMLRQHPPIDEAGIWVDCIHERRTVIHNDYSSLPHRKGLPEGHRPIVREMVAPVFDDGKIVAVLGVGNKEVNYDRHDVEIIQELSENVWELIARKRAEEELAVRERVYRRTHFSVEHSHSAMIWLALDGTITDCNRKLCFYTGFTRDELLGKSVASVNPDWTRERLEQELLPVLIHGKSPARFESELFRKEQTKMPVSIEISRFSFEGDDMLLAVATDISRRKHAEQIQTQLETELRQSQKMEAIGTLAGGIAHDFNNILTSMIGCTELAIKYSGENERLIKYLGVVRNGERRASELVAQILTFARQNETMVKAPLQLDKTISEVMTFLRASIPASVDIQTTIDRYCRPVMANASQIHQVVMNLMTNAYQSLPEGKGILYIALREQIITVKEAAKLLKIKPGEYLVLSISDNGCGMSADQMERIFDPYFTTRHMNDGTGFGLTIVRQVIQSHAGTVMVESSLDEGSVFKVYLPLLHGDSDSTSEETKELFADISGNEQILLVDDEAEIRLVLKEGLEELGYRVVIARDAIQVLQLLNESPRKFDAIISDMTMPIMSGVDLAKKIQQVNALIPVVLMSGYAKSGICEASECVNILEVLQKPIDVEGVARALRRALAQSENKRDIMAES